MEERILEKLEISEKKRKQLKKIAIRERKIKMYLVGLCLVLMLMVAFNTVQLHNAKKQLESYQQRNNELQATLNKQHELYMNTSEVIMRLGNNIVELHDNNEELKKKYNSSLEMINYYAKRSELYNKYEFALFYNGPSVLRILFCITLTREIFETGSNAAGFQPLLHGCNISYISPFLNSI